MMTMAIWFHCGKSFHQIQMSIIFKEKSFSQIAVHSYCSFKQEWLFRTPADTIGRHHNRKKLNSKYATQEAFPA
jgi:hypothetical protein